MMIMMIMTTIMMMTTTTIMTMMMTTMMMIMTMMTTATQRLLYYMGTGLNRRSLIFHITRIQKLTCRSAHNKAYRGLELQLNPFLASALDGGGWLTLPLYSRGKSPWDPLFMRLSGAQNLSGRVGEAKNLLTLPGIEPRIVQPVA
jgi:hypothetical protein